MEVVVEIVEPGRRAPSIKRFDQHEISIGRGWDNHLVITDAQVDASHCVITIEETTDTVTIRDLASANGTEYQGKTIENSAEIAFGSLVTVGQTSFRVHRKDDSVAPTRVYSRSENILEKASHPAIAATVALIAVFSWQYLSFLRGGSKFDWNSQLQSLLTVGTMLVAWGLFWGLITKLFKHQFKFWPHLCLAASAMILLLVLREFESIVSFNTLSTATTQFVGAINSSLLIFLAVVAGLIITTNVKPKTRYTTAGILVGIFLLTDYLLPRLDDDSWVNFVPLETKSFPTSYHVSPSIPQSEFFEIIGENLDETMERGIEAKEEQAESS